MFYSTNTSLPGTPAPSVISFDLYQALVECFSIIICGYVAGRMNIISVTEAKGLNTFVGTFALPATIFMSMATLNFSSVNWKFLGAVLLSKASVFGAVAVITLLVTRPVDLRKSGLFAVFCTQSNDFALGYPIIAALYSQTHPDYASYLYLMAPISLVILNPIGFLLMEIGNRRAAVLARSEMLANEGTTANIESKASLFVAVLGKIFFNPVVLMTTLGIIGNFFFQQSLPNILERILKDFGSAFTAAALFLLGLRMVGQMHNLRGAKLVLPSILICVKCLVLPLVTREIVVTFNAGSDANETLDLSNFGFLYGTFPTAPGVFVYATQFNVEADLVASAMVACTFLSAPLMFISAKMLTLKDLTPSNYIGELDAFLFNISIISIVAASWVLGIFLIGRKQRKVPHFYTFCLVISQFLGCFGVILWSTLGCCKEAWQLYLQFIFISLGVFGSRLWTALLALSLYFLRTRSLCFVLKLRPYFIAFGWGIPAIIATILLSTVDAETDDAQKVDPNFQYGETQAIVAAVVLMFSLLVTVICLIMQQRYGKKYSEYQSLRAEDEYGYSASGASFSGSSANVGSLRGNTSVRREESTALLSESENDVVVRDIEDFGNLLRRNTAIRREASNLLVDVATPGDAANEVEEMQPEMDERDATQFCTSMNCNTSRQQQCIQIVNEYINPPNQPEEAIVATTPDEEHEVLRHVVLLLVLSCSMFVGITLCMWTIVVERVSGIYLELLFFDGVLNYGQGFLTCLIFGFDDKLIISPLMRKWRHFWDGARSLVLPRAESLDPETTLVCEQFKKYHMDKCIKDLVKDRRRRLKTYRKVFLGKDLIDWLLLVGLAHDRSEALRYGKHLVDGRVIRHINNEYHFHDQPFFYTFQPVDNASGRVQGHLF